MSYRGHGIMLTLDGWDIPLKSCEYHTGDGGYLKLFAESVDPGSRKWWRLLEDEMRAYYGPKCAGDLHQELAVDKYGLPTLKLSWVPRRKGNWITTFTGKKFWPLDPYPADVDIRDIAHSLANMCRFQGHVKRFYSIAQHSVMGSRLFHDVKLARHFLVHDAAEAYVPDLAKPLKGLPEFTGWSQIDQNLQACIRSALGLEANVPPEIKDMDRRMLKAEQEQLMLGGHDEDLRDVQAAPIDLTITSDQIAAERMYLAEASRLGLLR